MTRILARYGKNYFDFDPLSEFSSRTAGKVSFFREERPSIRYYRFGSRIVVMYDGTDFQCA